MEWAGTQTASEPPPKDSEPAPPALTGPFLTIDNFLGAEQAGALRCAFEAHFSDPHKHGPATHQVWNYWHVPDLYTYLRTSPEKVLPRPLVEAFHARLRRFAIERLGLGMVTWSNLSLYVDGCVQHLHNDSVNGRFGFVYSLTPDARRGLGGETIVLREGDLMRCHLNRSGAGPSMQELIAPRFDRLTLFDDRMPHGVRRVEGGMDPLDGRVVLHGHISEDRAHVEGPLDPVAVQEQVRSETDPVLVAAPGGIGDYHGPLTVRLAVEASGRVSSVCPLVARVFRATGGDTGPLVRSLLERLAELRFPAADEPSVAFVPIMVGGPLPWMREAGHVTARPAPAAREAAPKPAAAAPVVRATAASPVAAKLAATPGASRIPKDRLEAFVVRDFIAPADLPALQADFDPASPAAAALAARIDALLGLDPALADALEAETVGSDGLECAFDGFDMDDPEQAQKAGSGGQRSWTVLAFLDAPVAGGQLLFPNAGLKLTPAAGYLLAWNNLTAAGEPNGFAVHETLPVEGPPHRRLVRRYRR